MIKALIHWCLSALALGIVSVIVPGFHIDSIGAALIAVLVIGLANATIGFLLKIVTFPLTILTLGLFWFVINALMIELASHLVNGFEVANFGCAFLGAIVLSLVNMVLKTLFEEKG
jgi:putative membrane protein